MWRSVLVVVTVAMLGFAGAAAGARLMADYDLRDSYASSGGSYDFPSAPDLTPVGTVTFADETIGATTQRVLHFAANSGLSVSCSYFSPIDGLYSYTVALLLRLDSVDGWAKVLDFKNASTDDGLYVADGKANFWLGASNPGTTAIATDEWVTVVFLRAAAFEPGISVYVNGVHQLTLYDPAEAGTCPSVLRFFLDDNQTSGEVSSGAVARIQLYADWLFPPEIERLSLVDMVFHDGFEDFEGLDTWSNHVQGSAP